MELDPEHFKQTFAKTWLIWVKEGKAGPMEIGSIPASPPAALCKLAIFVSAYAIAFLAKSAGAGSFWTIASRWSNQKSSLSLRAWA